MPISGELPDAAKRRLSQILDAGLEPRVQSIRIHHVDSNNGYVMGIRVPASYDGPHCVRINNLRRFVMRNGTSTSDLTFDQLRAAFDRTATLSERARGFIDQRLQLIGRKTPKPIMEGPICVVHFVPLAGLAGRHMVDLGALYSSGYTQFLDNDWGSGTRTFNLDGLVVHPGGGLTDKHYAYTHIFRTGTIEATSSGGEKRQMVPGGNEVGMVWASDMTKFYRNSVETFMHAAKKWGFAGPAVLSFALLHVKDYQLSIGGSYRHSGMPDREHLILPEVWIENLDTADRDNVVRPMMDMLWQAFGVERCYDFDAGTGEYKPRN